MKQTKLFLLPAFCLLSASVFAQIGFTNQNNLLFPAYHNSGVAIAVLDMNGDGRDDIVRMNQGKQLGIEYQGENNQAFTHLSLGQVSSEKQWGICAADVDNNGFPDLLIGGAYDGIHFYKANSNGTGYTVSNLTAPGTFVQSLNFADINNDGWLDAFVCHDDGTPRIFANDGAGNFTYSPQWMDLSTMPASDGSGNYGTVWSDVDNDHDLDLYIAKCRQGVANAADGRRINQLFLNNGDNTYTQDLTNAAGLRIGAQSWTADFGDIDNDGDFDCFVTNHDVPSQLLENDGAGHFTDISAASGVGAVGGLPIQGIFRDFDNDGFVDLLVAGQTHYMLRNNGDKTFTVVANLFFNNAQMESCAIGDLNHDGFQDIYGGYAETFNNPTTYPDVLWMNNGNDNHFFGLNLRGIQSNRDGVGARITVYSPLGIQIREVRSGESYGIMNSMQMHFGLGQLTEVDSVVVRWPSGIVDVLVQPSINQYFTIYEGGCIVPTVTAFADGPTSFCSGQSVQLGTTEDFVSYEWNTGDTTATITASAAGQYMVTITIPEGCSAVSNFILVTVDPVETPSISVSGDTVFCAGGAVTLTASSAFSYLWNTGEITQSISVGQAGNYTVVTQGLCAQYMSAPQKINILDAPPPVATGDTTWVGGAAILTTTGNNVVWYNDPADPTVIFYGNTLNIPSLAATDTFWVANITQYDTPNQFTGMLNHVGTPLSSNNTNGQIIFDCFKPVRLARVKVYTAKAGNRKIDLYDNSTNLLQTITVNIPVGTTLIDLNFDIPVGTDMILTTDPAVNQSTLNSNGPQLRRSDDSLAYPYVIPGVISINGGNTAGFTDRYYYFYNWDIDYYETNCESAWVPVIAFADPNFVSASEPAWGKALNVYPNPVTGVLNLDLQGFSGGAVTVSIKNALGATLQTQHREMPAGTMHWQTNLAGIPKGIYWVEVAANQGIVQRKIVVE